ncbi:jg3986 [Pararge aegeria aegeria]|uniref:Jg3986 protein n=1 Tax=Pararge aegeria aegeria TaxID=348720 RepID=A0A8S4R4D8_9NEOP|nr:jg3986 [Pararge aegeria aegeria]
MLAKLVKALANILDIGDFILGNGGNSLKLVERLRLPTVTECKVLGQLPNHKFGSDHLSLAATFELRGHGTPTATMDDHNALRGLARI